MQGQQQRRAIRHARFAEVHALRADGGTQKAIARHVELHPLTILRWLRADPTVGLSYLRGRRGGLLDPHKRYILDRCHAGCRNAAQLLRETQQRGFTGKYTILRDFLADVRQHQGLPPRLRSISPGTTSAAPPPTAPKMRQASARCACWAVRT